MVMLIIMIALTSTGQTLLRDMENDIDNYIDINSNININV